MSSQKSTKSVLKNFVLTKKPTEQLDLEEVNRLIPIRLVTNLID